MPSRIGGMALRARSRRACFGVTPRPTAARGGCVSEANAPAVQVSYPERFGRSCSERADLRIDPSTMPTRLEATEPRRRCG